MICYLPIWLTEDIELILIFLTECLDYNRYHDWPHLPHFHTKRQQIFKRTLYLGVECTPMEPHTSLLTAHLTPLPDRTRICVFDLTSSIHRSARLTCLHQQCSLCLDSNLARKIQPSASNTAETTPRYVMHVDHVKLWICFRDLCAAAASRTANTVQHSFELVYERDLAKSPRHTLRVYVPPRPTPFQRPSHYPLLHRAGPSLQACKVHTGKQRNECDHPWITCINNLARESTQPRSDWAYRQAHWIHCKIFTRTAPEVSATAY